ncbi:MAG: NAD(P)-dependent oxidoreductase [Daejeonella sp.]|uniref:NAD(P)-dependent oxidoreductase n=1 Tax=Daejeonella sp. TaxID=2805397 RepID=UPI0027371C00|nr:NAD(P)-dependent oxidoreductase [Daejeonella sp.]MDP3468449.1 NAD(P)-dependent oxidoreductase [Daejeonella sp.]
MTDENNNLKQDVLLINTERGAVMNMQHVIETLKRGKIGYLGTDVYEKEKGISFYDHSKNPIQDEMLEKLISFPNVIVTPHQAYATKEALSNIADNTFYNIDCWAQDNPTENELTGKGTVHRYVPTTWLD